MSRNDQTEINNYISSRYKSWLDYSKFQCAQYGRSDEAYDILNEVIMNILQYPMSKLKMLYIKFNGKVRVMDSHVLVAIRNSVKLPTSGYNYKYHKDEYFAHKFNGGRTVSAVDNLTAYDVIDDNEDGRQYDRMIKRFRAYCAKQGLSEKAVRIFIFRFFEHKKWVEWDGQENKYELLKTYRQTMSFLFKKLKITKEAEISADIF